VGKRDVGRRLAVAGEQVDLIEAARPDGDGTSISSTRSATPPSTA
jgi:hypothetical protein